MTIGNSLSVKDDNSNLDQIDLYFFILFSASFAALATKIVSYIYGFRVFEDVKIPNPTDYDFLSLPRALQTGITFIDRSMCLRHDNL